MSASIPLPTVPPAPSVTPWWSASGLVSVFSLVLLLAGFVVAYLLKNETAMTMLIGAVVTNATTVVNFYMGSSRSSRDKDATIAAIAMAPAPVALAPASVGPVAPSVILPTAP